jgi:hypothetical protein
VPVASNGGTDGEPAATAAEGGCFDQGRQTAFLIIIFIVFVKALIAIHPACNGGAHHEPATAMTADGRRNQQASESPVLVILFARVIYRPTIAAFPRKGQGHNTAAAATPANCCGNKETAKMPLFIVILVVFEILILDTFVFVSFARESQAHHPATTATSQCCSERKLSSIHFIQAVEIVIGVLGHGLVLCVWALVLEGATLFLPPKRMELTVGALPRRT